MKGYKYNGRYRFLNPQYKHPDIWRKEPTGKRPDPSVSYTHLYFQSEEGSCGNEKNAVERAKIYLENHIDQPLSAADVAAALFMNADYLSRLFKNECGITLKEYILKIKMESARNLLQTTALPVSVIASKLGYDNFSYFSQAYRRVMGVSPTDERKD